MKFTVSQKFESLGDPFPEEFNTRTEAEDRLTTYREEIADYVQSLEISKPSTTGWADEVGAWNDALELANLTTDEREELEERASLSRAWPRESAELIAARAVTLEEELDEE